MLSLHAVTAADLPFRQALLADPATMAYNAPWAPPEGTLPFPETAWAAWLEKWTGHAPERWCGIVTTEDGTPVGEVCWHGGGAEIGVVIHAAHRGRGLGAEAIALLAAEAFRHGEITQLCNRFEAGRETALRLHLRAGFVVTGEQDGLLTLRLTRERWEGRRRDAWLRAVLDAMCLFDAGDPKRIHHLLKVHALARQIGLHEGLDENTLFTLEVAALVHDIGIRPAEAQFGRCTGEMQERLGPPEAERLLGELGLPAPVIRRVSFLVGHHHTTRDVAGIDWQILLEADFLVNLYEEPYSPEVIDTYGKNVFRTPEGLRLLSQMR